MGKDRRADAVMFAFDFQVNAAIVLMLDNINELQSLRLESENEDIDIVLRNGKHILAQAKSVVKSSTDFRNVRTNLRKALTSLSEGSANVEAEKLIFITNSPNPLKEEESRSIFYGLARRTFNTLPPASQNIINSYLKEIDNPLDTEQFTIQVVPFETDDETERFKVVLQCINDFVSELKLESGIGKQLHRIWRDEIFKNGTKNSTEITLSKESLVWPIIVIVTDINRTDQDFREQFDSVQYDEVVHNFQNLIDSCCERFEFFTKILYDFNAYNNSGKPNEKTINFVDEHWQKYSSEFEGELISSDIVESLTKVVVYNVVRRRYDIDKIKKGVSL